MMQILIRDLHKDAATFGQQLARQQQPIAQVAQVGVQAQLPGVAIGLDHLRLADHLGVLAVLDIALAHEGLKVGAKFHPIGRVDVDHLHLTAEPFVLQQ